MRKGQVSTIFGGPVKKLRQFWCLVQTEFFKICGPCFALVLHIKLHQRL